MDRERWLGQRKSKRRRHACAYQQGSGEPRPLRVSDAVEVGENFPRFEQQVFRQWHHPANMVTRGELRHDTAIGFMRRHLGMQRVPQQPLRAVIKRNARFVAGSLDT